MEWNAKWDWESLDIFSSKAVVEGEENLDSGSFNLSGGFDGTSHSASDVGNNSSAKSSISASTESSLKEVLKTSNFTFDGFEKFPEDFSSKKGLAPPMEASVGSGEPFIGLKLGKRTYFENGCAKSSSKTSSFSDTSSIKKVRSSCQTVTNPRCQVEGCNLDLSSAKEYHRKHKVCGNHSRCPLVIIGGRERRFCQQCSRFHCLSEFDDQKRSCRRRLSDHNARRRKPQQETIQFNSSNYSSPFYDGRHQLSFVLNNVPAVQTRPATSSTWDSTCSSKYPTAKLKAGKEGGVDVGPHFRGTQLPHTVSMPNHAFSQLMPSKGARLEVQNQGHKESMSSSNVDAASLDLHRALSLLSNNSWASSSCESDLITSDPTMNFNQTSMHTFPRGLPLSSSRYWQVEQQSNDSHNHYQGPYETRAYSHPMN